MNRLAITRAFGDFEFKTVSLDGEMHKRDYITCMPEIRMLEMDPFTDRFIVMGSDGLFDKATSQEIVNTINARIGEQGQDNKDYEKIARILANETIAKNVKDNVTCVIVGLGRGGIESI
jgi:serine/threonine protein phosphatase PrpC